MRRALGPLASPALHVALILAALAFWGGGRGERDDGGDGGPEMVEVSGPTEHAAIILPIEGTDP